MVRRLGLGFEGEEVREKKVKRRMREMRRRERRNVGERRPVGFSLFQAFAMEKEKERFLQ